MLGGPLGALLGVAFGQNFDRGMAASAYQELPKPGDQERVQTAFFTATFSVMGNLAKVNGRVCEDEIALASAVMEEMELTAEKRRAAMRLFNEGKARGFPLDEVLDQFKHECHRRHNLMHMRCNSRYIESLCACCCA